MKKHIFFNLILVLLSPWIIEISLNYFIRSDSFIETKNITIQKNHLLKKDKKNQLEILKKQGYQPTVYPTILSKKIFYQNLMLENEFLPLGAQPNTKTYFCDEGYGFIKFKTDYLGFRNKAEDWKKNKLALIGDSYVHGSCVEDDYTISGHLKKKGIDNLNLGIGNHQPAQYYHTIDQFIINERFQNVALLLSLHNDLLGLDNGDSLFLNNFNSYLFDMETNEFKLSNGGKIFYENLKNNFADLINEETEINIGISYESFFKLHNLRNALKANFGISINKDLICIIKFCLYGSLEKRFEKELVIIKKTILKLTERCNPEKKCNPIVILLHHPKFYDHNITYDFRRIYFNKFINKFKEETSYLKYIDASEFIDPNMLKNYAPAGSHFSKSGYEEVANIIYDNLR